MITADEAKALMPKNMDLKAIISADEALWDDVDAAIIRAAEQNEDSIVLFSSDLKRHFEKITSDHAHKISMEALIKSFTECLEDLHFAVIVNKIVVTKYNEFRKTIMDHEDTCWHIKW